ncbi:segregation and condensation protein A [Polynucleobacter sp. TUM22923]|jgi:segregation and condensation protein A|uniref:segregation and condensation protein A n=1 Tax=Polynucleobacter sp. TUM22923 TaxID=3022126 RepID=UPI002572DB33|nr:ScpA family protein [Polynucleobacter sp. TUM22923]BDX21106.1 segregation and condensation protein A [Polynucleobacter sp. TUM22923]
MTKYSTEPSTQPIGDLLDSTPSVTDGMSSAFAKLYGEPLFKLPTDLYIPPDALEIFLEAFEGPLDLLLYLIRKQNFNVLDIPMAQVTQQYLSYVDQIRHHNLELAAEYLLMAAMLIEIKSRMLLPMKKADSDEEVEDPRAELVRRLLEYERMKLAAQELDQIPQQGRDFQIAHGYVDTTVAVSWPEVNLEDLQMAWRDVLHRAKLTQHHTITREELSVRDFMTRILRRLQSTRFVEFSELFEDAINSGKGIPVVIVNFIAMLELSREALVEITQAEPYAPIYVRLAYTPV